MNIQAIKHDFNRGHMMKADILLLIEEVERLENEHITLSQSIEEDDAMISQLQDEVKLLKLHESILLERVKKAESKSRFHKYMELEQENLALAQENVWYKERLKDKQSV